MEILFNSLLFEVKEGKVGLKSICGKPSLAYDNHIVEVQIAGRNHDVAGGAKQFYSSESESLRYVRHEIENGCLTIVQENERIRVFSVFQTYHSVNAVRCHTEVENISKEAVVLEHVSSLVLFGMGDLDRTDEIDLYRFFNSWHVECQPRKFSLFDLGLFLGNHRSNKRVYGCNVGSWSSKEELPQAIIGNRATGNYLMFQIESNNSWYWEIGENESNLYLNAGGGNQRHTQWSKKLQPQQRYRTVNVGVAVGCSVNQAIEEMTKYRRRIVRPCKADQTMPTIFNEYMHLSWDSPSEERTARLAPSIAALGVEYYVIDCGWHNEERGDNIYPYVGQWKESKARFPLGIKHTVEYIHSCGMKAGLWLEPEIIGHLCEDMLAYYPKDAYFYRNGEVVTVMGRKFLDFRNAKVIEYLNSIIDFLLGECGVDYLKFDYNEDCGPGTEFQSDSLGDGLERHSEAYFAWVESIMRRYPDVLIETCSSGGQRMDYKTLSQFPIVSSSDQTNYKKYPCIVGNILSAVLPEQAAVWSYPVQSLGSVEETLQESAESVNARITGEDVAMNMINALLGRIHLASDISKLNKEKQELVREGLAYFKSIANDKRQALPYFPLGFTHFKSDFVCAGFRTERKIYLAVWNLGKVGEKRIDIDFNIKSVKCAYPSVYATKFTFEKHSFTVQFNEQYMARFFELDIE